MGGRTVIKRSNLRGPASRARPARRAGGAGGPVRSESAANSPTHVATPRLLTAHAARMRCPMRGSSDAPTTTTATPPPPPRRPTAHAAHAMRLSDDA
eukprot:4037860-Prymnesium_polylepis.2